MMKIKSIALTLFLLILVVMACSNNTSTPTSELDITLTVAPTQEQIPTPTVTAIRTPTQIPNRLPLTDAEVPRVTVENAKAAFDNGKAIIVDVRSQQSFDVSHIVGALYVPIADMENNSAESVLPKDQWIITYCT